MKLPRPVHLLNEGAAFLLELAALAALCWWGFRAGGTPLGLGAPLAAAVSWSLFAAPTARIRLPLPAVYAVKLLVFTAATLALVGVGHPYLAFTFAALALANTLTAILDADALLTTTRAAPP